MHGRVPRNAAGGGARTGRPQGRGDHPEYAAVASAVGGSAVTVATLAKPTEDPHFVDAKPSHVVTLNRADVLIEGGADLEAGWLPPLLEGARNPKIARALPGTSGPAKASRSSTCPRRSIDPRATCTPPATRTS
jgi:zinc/manganese transport system substrate-binding protein